MIHNYSVICGADQRQFLSSSCVWQRDEGYCHSGCSFGLLLHFQQLQTSHEHEIKLRYLSTNPLISKWQLHCSLKIMDNCTVTCCVRRLTALWLHCVQTIRSWPDVWPLFHPIFGLNATFIDRCTVEMTGNNGEWREMTKNKTELIRHIPSTVQCVCGNTHATAR